MHTILIIISVWESVIVNFDKPELMDLIPRWASYGHFSRRVLQHAQRALEP
jgi:hypothetical protein